MLKHLYIQNFILIDEINLDFEEGFSAFTGETGAGKSILLDAISTLSFSRASASLISKGKDKAIIEATFDITSDKHACSVMKESGFDVQDETTFTREIHSNGKSVTRIDHRVVTSSLMKDVLKYQIDIHGQRDTPLQQRFRFPRWNLPGISARSELAHRTTSPASTHVPAKVPVSADRWYESLFRDFAKEI